MKGRPCVVEGLRPRGKGAYVTTICQDFPNEPMYIDPVMYSRLVHDQIVNAPRPVIKIVLFTYGGHGGWQYLRRSSYAPVVDMDRL